MYQFLALAWNSRNPAATATARRLATQLIVRRPTWKIALDSEDLVVLDDGSNPRTMHAHPLQGGSGVVLGQVFRRDGDYGSAPGATAFGPGESERLAATAGSPLMTGYWGRYVGFIRGEMPGQVHIVCDPIGGLPCFHMAFDDVHVFFSHPKAIRDSALFGLSVNWRFVAAFLRYGYFASRETGLNEVSQLFPGECLSISPEGSERTFHWHPADIARTGVIEDRNIAIAAVRDATLSSVSAWASCYDRILHRMSGGLDSSIVLACLKESRTPVDVIGMTHFTEAKDGDERVFARLMARHAGVRLIERADEPENVKLDQLLEMGCSVSPIDLVGGLDRGRDESRLACEFGADALSSGLGGDMLFIQCPTSDVVADYISRRRPGSGLFDVAIGVARLRRLSVWRVLLEGMRTHYKGPRQSAIARSHAKDMPVIAREVAAALDPDSFGHPWFKDMPGIPPGKSEHITSMIMAPIYYEPLPRGEFYDPIHPLISQPLIELCLRIPTYLMIDGGRDRFLARKAFMGMVPERILARQSKGTPTNHYARVIDDNLPFLRELLLEGVLVRQKLLDRDYLEKLLTLNHRVEVKLEIVRLLSIASAEAWARGWCDGVQEAPPEEARQLSVG